jgi:superfamily II DNA or RNA helicase
MQLYLSLSYLLSLHIVDFHSLLLREAEWPQDLDDSNDLSQGNEIESIAASLSTEEFRSKSDTSNVKKKNGFDEFYGEDQTRKGRNNTAFGMTGRAQHAEQLAENLNHTLQSKVTQILEPLSSRFQTCIEKNKGVKNIEGEGFHVYRLHGNVPQRNRQLVYQQFCDSKRGVLFCTDVAARGLDLPKVDWILQVGKHITFYINNYHYHYCCDVFHLFYFNLTYLR